MPCVEKISSPGPFPLVYEYKYVPRNYISDRPFVILRGEALARIEARLQAVCTVYARVWTRTPALRRGLRCITKTVRRPTLIKELVS